MVTVYVPDIGDGLAAGIKTLAGDRIQIDCGSQQSPQDAYQKGLLRIRPNAFFLSHFHADHYNGLYQALYSGYRQPPPLYMDQVYFPRIPAFQQRDIFLLSMLAINRRVMGSETGSMQADFLQIMFRICASFSYRALSAGETIEIGGSEMEVLWPPRVLSDDSVLTVVRKAISDFETAKAEDDGLRQIYEAMGEKGEIRPYIDGEEHIYSPERLREALENESYDSIERKELPEVVKRANDSLRAAANHFSLAFHEDNKFLFMGDLEAHEINEVVAELERKKRRHFVVLITPHHGTHWHDSLERISTWLAISSVGGRLFKNLSPRFKSIAYQCLHTHLSGNIEIPVFNPWWDGSHITFRV